MFSKLETALTKGETIQKCSVVNKHGTGEIMEHIWKLEGPLQCRNVWSKFLYLWNLWKQWHEKQPGCGISGSADNPYVSKDYFSSQCCRCNEKFLIDMKKSPKSWQAGMSCNLCLVASKSHTRSVCKPGLPQAGHSTPWQTQPERHLFPPKYARHCVHHRAEIGELGGNGILLIWTSSEPERHAH